MEACGHEVKRKPCVMRHAYKTRGDAFRVYLLIIYCINIVFDGIIICWAVRVCVCACVTYNTDGGFQVVKLLRKKALLSPPQSL